jgi:signal transduction histidine kinase
VIRPFVSVRIRLTAWYAALLSLVLTSAGVASYKLLEREMAQSVDAALVTSTRQVAAALADEAGESGGTLSSAAMQSVLAELHDAERPLAAFVPESHEHAVAAGRLTWPREALDQRLARRQFGFVTLKAQPPIRFLIAPAAVGDNAVVIAAGQSLAGEEHLLARVRRTMLIALPLGLLIACGGGWLLARKSFVPIEAAFAMQRQFMADASHELRSPVAILSGEIDVALARDDRDAADYRDSLAVMRRSVRRLTRIVSDLFLLARGDTGDLPILRGAFDLDEVVAGTARELRTVAAEQGVVIVEQCERGIRCEGDEELVLRAVVNLVENAIHHSNRGDSVIVRCSASGNEARVEVVDHGPGVPSELRERIFERFVRADRARSASVSARASGAGLGLPIARWIARRHGGDVRLAESGAAGSTFVLTLRSRH